MRRLIHQNQNDFLYLKVALIGPFVPRTGVLVPARFAKDLIDIKNNTKYYDFVPVLSVHLKDLKYAI